jgi:hypothetical protein
VARGEAPHRPCGKHVPLLLCPVARRRAAYPLAYDVEGCSLRMGTLTLLIPSDTSRNIEFRASLGPPLT